MRNSIHIGALYRSSRRTLVARPWRVLTLAPLRNRIQRQYDVNLRGVEDERLAARPVPDVGAAKHAGVLFDAGCDEQALSGESSQDRVSVVLKSLSERGRGERFDDDPHGGVGVRVVDHGVPPSVECAVLR